MLWERIISIAILDSPGESVCVEKQGKVEVSYIPLDEESEEFPIMAQLENIINVARAQHVHFKGAFDTCILVWPHLLSTILHSPHNTAFY